MKAMLESLRARAALVALLTASIGCGDPPPPAAAAQQAPSAPDVVRLSADAVSRNGIRVAAVTSRALGDFIDAPAEVQLDPDRVAHVAPLVAGQLQQVDVSVGDRVRANEALAVLRSVDLGQARAEGRRASAMLDVAQANLAREERLRTEGISSERSLLEAQLRRAETQADRDAARARLLVFGLSRGAGADVPITAPIGGTIIERHATRGENVGPDDDLFVIADTTKVWVLARVYERDMANVHMGASARLTVPAQSERSWDGQITFISPVVDETTRTLAVRIELDNDADGSLRPGLFGRLRIAVGEAPIVPAVPEDCVQTLRGAPVVFVPAGDVNTFRAQRVTLGRHGDGMVEIREGLAAGAQVVIAGSFLLKSQLMAAEFGEAE